MKSRECTALELFVKYQQIDDEIDELEKAKEVIAKELLMRLYEYEGRVIDIEEE